MDDLRNGRMTIGQALRSNDNVVCGLTLWTVLTAPRYMGYARAMKVIEASAVSLPHYTPLNQLSRAKREHIIQHLPERHR